MGYTILRYSHSSVDCGSSPLAWGIRVTSTNTASQSCGSSPLAWGIQRQPPKNQGLPPVHPHSRGVYVCHTAEKLSVSGSSPLAWGIPNLKKMQRREVRFIPTRVGYTQQAAHNAELGERFIPTRVGYTYYTSNYEELITVHPHSRGVYIVCLAFCVPLPRFIPTRVGYT